MPSKYSPGVLPDDGTQYFVEGAAAGLRSYFDLSRQRRLDREQAERDALDDALKRGELYDAGLREGTAPKRTYSSELPAPGLESRDAFAGQGMGMQPQGGPTRSPLAGNMQRAGMARLASFKTPEQMEPEVLALPGAFVPEIGGFTSTPIFNAPKMPGPQAPSMEIADPTKVQLNDRYWLDTQQTPEAREERKVAAERSRVSELLARFQNKSPEEARAAIELLEAGIPASVVFQDQPDDYTMDELRATNRIPEEILPLAMRDPAIARSYLDAPPAGDDPWSAETDPVVRRALEMERLRRAGELPRPGSPDDPNGPPEDAPSFSQAYDIVRNRYAKWRAAPGIGEPIGYETTEPDMVNKARALARGADPDSVLAPIASADTVAAETTPTSVDEPGIIENSIRAIQGFFRRMREAGREAIPEGGQPPVATPAPGGAPRPDSIAAARELVKGLPPVLQRANLSAVGFTEEEIRQILGGGGG